MEDVSATEKDLLKLKQLVGKVRTSRLHAERERREPKERARETPKQNKPDDDLILVSKRDLEKLRKEVRMLKCMVSNTINHDLMPICASLKEAMEDSESAKSAVEAAEIERDHWRSQWQGMQETTQKEKQEKLALRCELQTTIEQLTQQSEFCSTMGAACCTLLWRVSRCEDSIQSILVGTKVDEFLGMVGSTLESYLQTYQEEQPSDSADETQFVLALCGIITNIAASAFGRDFLMKQDSGHQLVDTYISILGQSPCHKLAKMKNLILMGLYNLTINQKGLKYITSKSGILSLLAWQLQANNDTENRMNALRLIQSLLYEQDSQRLIHEAKEALPVKTLSSLARDPCADIREAAKEIQTDLQAVSSEQ